MHQDSDKQFFQKLQQIEQRYEFENRLMEQVRKGQLQKARQDFTIFPQTFLDRRTDPVRDARNYTIILNTLMRKAAEQGGVPPVYIDRVSTEFALRIESTTHWDRFMALWQEMLVAYCKLVQKQATAIHSPLVRKVISRIDLDLASDLRLAPISRALNVNPSYLSTLFRRETGKTLTNYVTEKRMEHGAFLLQSTNLSVAVIAQRCGIADDNYFAKLFRRHHGLSPTQYRQKHNC
jgi:YesN/AraC family two-component response regulator